jgi:CHAT domain-containing protein
LDEQLGLVAACHRAGACSVLATLWSLDDDHVADLAESYHRRLVGGDAPAEALRRAQQIARASGVPDSVWGAVVSWGLPPRYQSDE